MSEESVYLGRRVLPADEDDETYTPDLQALSVVVSFLYASHQDDEADNLVGYFGCEESWEQHEVENKHSASHSGADVPDSLNWGHALLDFVRSLAPVQAAFIGAIAVSPPWWSAAETMPLGKIVNMLEIAECGELYREERPDWEWFPHRAPSWEIFLRGAPAFVPFPPRRELRRLSD